MCTDTENQEANTQDKLEIAIRNNISVGQTFKSMSAVYKTIGFELLGISDLNGGKQCDAAKAMVEQYARFELLTPNGYSVQCVEIFEKPHYIEKADGRGKKGFYIDRLVPLLLKHLHELEGDEWTTSVKKLAVALGIVKQNYSNFPKSEEYFTSLYRKLSISEDYFKQFYNRSKTELEPKIISALDRLKKDGVLDYERRFLIRQSGNKYHLSDDEEFSIIKETEKIIVEQMGAKNKRSIYFRRKGEEFERNVLTYINGAHKLNWELCAPVLHLRFYHHRIVRCISENYPRIFEDYKVMATEVRKSFASAIRRKAKRDYEHTNGPMNKRAAEIFDQLKADEDICLFYNEDELKDKALQFARRWMSSKKDYYFWPDYLPKQDILTQIFIG